MLNILDMFNMGVTVDPYYDFEYNDSCSLFIFRET